MYINIGNGRYVRRRHILGIFDFDSATVSSVTRSTLRQKEKEGLLSSSEEDIPKALLLISPPKNAFPRGKSKIEAQKTKPKEQTKIYLSKFSSGVLTARAVTEDTEFGE